MKKILSLLLAIVMVGTVLTADPVYTDPYDEIQETFTYTSFEHKLPETINKIDGTSDFRTVVANYDFRDLTAFYKKAATELAVLGIVSGSGRNVFSGNAELSNIQTVTMLVRFLGAEKQVKDRVKAENPDIPNSKLNGYYQDAFMDYALTNGIIESKEIKYHDKVSRENMALWMVNATKISSENSLPPVISDKNRIQPKAEQAIYAVLDHGLMSTFADGTFKPRNLVKREHFAKILSATLNKFPQNFGVEKKFAIVVGVQPESVEGNRYTNLIVKNEESELEIIRYGTLANETEIGFPVLNGNLMYPGAIQKGMELELLLKDGKIILATVLDQNQVKHAIVQKQLSEPGVDVLQGVVKSNTSEKRSAEQEKWIRTRLRVELDDDRVVDFLQERNQITNIDNDVLVLGKNGFIPIEALRKNDTVTAYVKNDKVLFLKLGTEPLQNITGSIRQIEVPKPKSAEEQEESKPFIKVYTDDGRLVDLPVNDQTVYYINQYGAKLEDLKLGARVNVVVLRGYASFVNASSYQPPSGYIPKEGKIAYVTVKELGDKYFTVQENGDKIAVFDGVTKITKQGKAIRFQSLKSGDKVKLYFDDIYSKAPSRIEVSEAATKVQGILKGRVLDYSNATGFLSVLDLMQLDNASWVKMPDHMKKYKLDEDVRIYANGRLLSRESLNPAVGENIYLVLRDGELSQAVFSAGRERNFSNTVKSYDNVLNQLQLANGRNLRFGEDTIFVEDNRLVGKDSLEQGKALQILSNEIAGDEYAKLVSILDQNEDFFDRIYLASIDEVDEYTLTIRDYTQVRDMKFSPVKSSGKQIDLYNESSIYAIDSKKLLSAQDLFHGDYYRKRYKEKNDKRSISNKGLEYKRYYGIFFVDAQDKLIAAKIRHKGIFEDDLFDDRLKKESDVPKEIDKVRQRLSFTRGTIAEFNTDWQRISLNNSFQFFEFDKKWKPNREATVISLRNALIIKNEKVIDYEDLRVDDKVYAVRDDEKVLFLYVEE